MVIRRMLAGEFLEVLTPGVYVRGGSVSWLGRAWAGLLLGGPPAVLGLEAAAHLHGLLRKAPDEVVVFTPRRVLDRPGWRFVRSERAGSGEPVRTPVDATVIDLCADRDEDGVAALLADAISGRLTSAARLRAELQARRWLKNRALLNDILGDVSGGAHSALERRYLVHVEQAHKLPTAVRQVKMHASHRSDGLYQGFGVIVELDSKLHHGGGAAFDDMQRDNDHAALGLTTLRIGWSQVSGTLQCQTARFVGQLLMVRGWEGPVGTCPRCRLVQAI